MSQISAPTSPASTPTVPTSITGNTGTATPAANSFKIAGTNGIDTVAGLSTVTVSLTSANFVVTANGVQMKGSNTNTPPPAGFIGEILVGTATAVATTTGVAKTIALVNLTAGIWDVSGNCLSLPTGGTSIMTNLNAGINVVTNVLPTSPNIYQLSIVNGSNIMSATLAPVRVSVVAAGTTPVYLVVSNTYSSTTCPTDAKISATRVG